jgi:hypothetical protein
MSFDGHVLCQRMLMTPWALTTFGAATADAAAATLRKLRRVVRAGFDNFDMAFLSLPPGRFGACPFLIKQPACARQQLNVLPPDNPQGLYTYQRRSRTALP